MKDKILSILNKVVTKDHQAEMLEYLFNVEMNSAVRKESIKFRDWAKSRNFQRIMDKQIPVEDLMNEENTSEALWDIYIINKQ